MHSKKGDYKKKLPHPHHGKSEGWAGRKTGQEQYGSEKHAEWIEIQSNAVNFTESLHKPLAAQQTNLVGFNLIG